MLIVKQLSKRFRSLRALDQLSFSIPNKSITGIIGPNGAGKTTLLLCLAGLIPIDNGTIRWDGEVLSTPFAYRDVCFLVEDAIRPHAMVKVDSVLKFYASVFGRTPKFRDDLAERLKLGGFLRTRICELSKGAAKRFLIAVAMLSTRPVLMLDEPFDGLDLKQTRELIPMFQCVSTEGRTLVLSIHQLSDAERVCDRFVLLNNGVLAGTGTLAELQSITGATQRPGLEEIFLSLT